MAEESTSPEFLLWLQWRQGEHPDARAFLARFHLLAPTRLAAALRVDQRERWAIGQRVPAADYLRDFPALRDDPEAAIEVIFGEFVLRDRLGESPELGQYQREHPEYAAQLAIQVELRRALEGQAEDGATIVTRGDETLDPGSDIDLPPAPVAEMPSPPGYEIIAVLGRGGMGVVYKARDSGLGRYVALKFLHLQTLRDGPALARFRREARAASALNHPAVCTLYGLGECEGRPFLVLEWVEGQTFRALVGPNPDLTQLLSLVWQVASALQAAHAAGIIHRDIKPENLMVRPDGFVKVLDFGLARLLPAPAGSGTAPDGVTGSGVLLGTARYMSPEQARAEPVDAATDIFSLGLVLYELAAGRHPFEHDEHLDVMYALAHHPALLPTRLNPEIPAPLENLILHMLEKDPRRRPTAAEVAGLLGELAIRGDSEPAFASVSTLPRRTVGRERERAALLAGFESTAAGRGLILCVTGEPGIGKTTLVEDFLAELAAGRAHGGARGRCSERLAGTEAYLPVLEALENLLRGASGEAAARAMRLLAPAWYSRVAPLAGVDLAGGPTAAASATTQEQLKREFLALVEELSRSRPLVLFLDDVHWADASTVDLLAFLGARCAGLRLLVLLTYRPTELLLGQHPFGPVQLELQRHGVCRELPLGFLGRAEVETYLALAYPAHRFPAEFASVIYAKTEGSPLFLVDLLRYLQDREVIAEGPDGWGLAEALPDFRRALPESVRSLIQKKLDQLGEVDRRLLSAASVQGYEFDSGVVAAVLDLDPVDVEERLEVLDRVHRLVGLRREHEFPDGTLVLRYQFVHVLYQNALYEALQPARRAAHSAAVARALLNHHGDQSGSIAGELALLLEVARDWGEAVAFFHIAAENAAGVHAHQEAAVLARRGLALLPRVPDNHDRGRREVALLITLGSQLAHTLGWSSPEVGQIYRRAYSLCRQGGEDAQRAAVMWGLCSVSMVQAEYQTARAVGEEFLRLALVPEDPAVLLLVHNVILGSSFHLGDLDAAVTHAETGTTFFVTGQNTPFIAGEFPAVICLGYSGWALWMTGFPDQARERVYDAVSLAREHNHHPGLAHALYMAAVVHWFRREPQNAQECAEAVIALCTEHSLHFWLAGGTIMRGWALAAQGESAAGVAQIHHALAEWQSTGARVLVPFHLAVLAEALSEAGRTEEALASLAEALTVADATGERAYNAELLRLRGELLLRQASGGGGTSPARDGVASTSDRDPSGHAEAEACFRRGLDIACRQGAKSLELRGALSLARLLRATGRQSEGRRLLAETYGGFTEGWDTPDLKAAQAFLQEPTIAIGLEGAGDG
jgi:predicted ATPase